MSIKNRLRKLLGLIAKAKTIAQTEPTKLNEVFDKIEKAGVEYRDVAKLPQVPTDDDILKRVRGGDQTTGSCASLAFALVANKVGLNVLDFRGGKSLDYFSDPSNLLQICEKVGGYSSFFTTGIQLMKQTEIGKLYYLAYAEHAAIVRQVSKGKYEYLELQSATDNGWYPLNSRVFGWLFGGSGK